MRMKPAFNLDQHPRRGLPPLSAPPAGYFEQLPARVMARVAAPAARPLLPAWRRLAPAYVRTGLASTVVLGTLAASLWLGGGPLNRPAAGAAGLDAVPTEQLVDYLTNGETPVDILDLSELPTRHLGLTRHYLRPSAAELTEALDAQPEGEASML